MRWRWSLGLAAFLCIAASVRAQESAPIWLETPETSVVVSELPANHRDRLVVDSRDFFIRVGSDFENFYLSDAPIFVGFSVAAMAPIANTYADRRMSDWYQRHAGLGKSHGADGVATAFSYPGDHRLTVPIYAVMSFGDFLFPESPTAAIVGEFGRRSLRALAVGTPTLAILQNGLGSYRPQEGDSHWRPFQSNHGASGHAFVGAIPFLTAASMTDSYFLKAILIAGSLGSAWSRVHHDSHYVSQVALGWTVAFLAVRAVDITEGGAFRIRFVPAEVANGIGLGLRIEY